VITFDNCWSVRSEERARREGGTDPERIPETNPAAQPPEAPATPFSFDSIMLATVWSTKEKVNPIVARMITLVISEI